MIGACVGLSNLEHARIAGFDYVELAGKELLRRSARSVLSECSRHDIPIRAINQIIPSNLWLHDPHTWGAIVEGCGRLARMAADLGCEILVFGSGSARATRGQVDRETADENLGRIVAKCTDLAEQAGLHLMLEPIRSSATDLINGLGEATEFLERYGLSDRVWLVADLFHVYREVIEGPVRWRPDRIGHAHICRADRTAPEVPDAEVLAYIHKLREQRYAGSVSLECDWDDFPRQGLRARLVVSGALQAMAAGFSSGKLRPYLTNDAYLTETRGCSEGEIGRL